MKKILLAFGTRSEAIKLMPVLTELRASHEFVVKALCTAQHQNLVQQVFSGFNLQPDFHLELQDPPPSLTQLAARLQEKIHPILGKENPDLLLVLGGTLTTISASISAFYHKIAIGHIEAGLRTSDRYTPFPEEMNRRLLAPLADIHFAPNSITQQNLFMSGVSPNRVFVTGSPGIDSFYQTQARLAQGQVEPDLSLAKIIEQARSTLVLVTLHRRENIGSRHELALSAIRKVAHDFPEKKFIFPVHFNPSVRKQAFDILGSTPNIFMLEPLDYPSLLAVLKHSELVVTDSGSLPEESARLRVPTLVLRTTTERPELFEQDCARLTSHNLESDIRSALNDKTWRNTLRDKPLRFSQESEGASQKILSVLKETRGALW